MNPGIFYAACFGITIHNIHHFTFNLPLFYRKLGCPIYIETKMKMEFNLCKAG
jgi:hypothetical protein